MPNSWHGLVGNRWSYSDLSSVPVGQICQSGVLHQLRVMGKLSSESGRWLPVYHCKVREGHRSLRIVIYVYSGILSSVRLQNELDVEQCVLQPVTPYERSRLFLAVTFYLADRLAERAGRRRSALSPSQSGCAFDRRPQASSALDIIASRVVRQATFGSAVKVVLSSVEDNSCWKHWLRRESRVEEMSTSGKGFGRVW